MVSNMLEAIPEPRPENCVNLDDIKSKSEIHLYVSICLFISPYPFYRSSSSSSKMRPVMKNWMMIDPMSLHWGQGSPHMLVRTYTIAWPTEIIILKRF